MSSTRRLMVVLGSLAVMSALAWWPTALAQKVIQVQVGRQPAPVPADDEGGLPAEFSAAITLPKNNDAQRKISAAEDLIAEENWGDAARALQSLLDGKEDAFLQRKRKDASGKETIHWVSIRAEANRLLGSMPPEGLQFYELQFGPVARTRLEEGKAKGNPEILHEVVQRFLHTQAGTEAINLLATYHLDRGEYLTAAQWFEQLLSRKGADQVSPRVLFKAAVAFRRAGDKPRADEVFRHLTARLRGSRLEVGNRQADIDQLRQEVERVVASVTERSIHDYPMYGGAPSRTSQGYGGPPFMEARFQRSTLPAEDTHGTRRWIEEAILKVAVEELTGKGQPVLPTFFPLAAREKMIYRAHDGIYAIHLRDKVLDWNGEKKVIPAGSVAWMSPSSGSLWGMGNQPANRQQYLLNPQLQWFPIYQQAGLHHVFLENSVIGTLTTDNQRVYAVDDLAVPPSPQMFMQFGWNQQMMNLGPFQRFLSGSKLQAFDIESGKLKWELPSPPDKKQTEEFDNAFFLAPPLPLGRKLYVLIEKNAELRLVCLDPPKEDFAPPRVVWSQALATTRDRLPQDVSRRLHAASMAYGDGILVCPTNAGAVLGVDLATHSLLWAHSYRENDSRSDQNVTIFNGRRIFRGDMPYLPAAMNSEWKVSAPCIQEGKVVFAAPDGSSIHCLNLRDGRLLWKAERSADDLYLAGVYSGKVVIVGKNYCRALALAEKASARELWKVPTGMPSGQGVASDNVYYLPLRETHDSKDPAVLGIDLDKGVVRSRTMSRKKEVPGNLVFYDGDVLSQTVTHVAAYPQLRVKLAQIDERLQGNPNDPVGLTERAELRLDKGDREGAVADLRVALANQPPAELVQRARTKLYEAITELIQLDFNANEKHLAEYKELCLVPVPAGADPATRQRLAEEQLRRQTNYLCLLAKGREKQGRLLDAFEAYMEFGALNSSTELVTVIDEPTTRSRPHVWARGRIGHMLRNANPDQRRQLEEKIAQRWSAVKDSGDTVALRQFVDLFGSISTSGRTARLQLAERLIEEGNDDGLREAQLHLLQLRNQKEDMPLAGLAVETLARLMLRKGLTEHAAYYYRELGRDFARVIIKDGRTGADFYSDLATDKRFLPYLEEQKQSWNGELRYQEIGGQFPMQPSFTYEADGELLPFFRRHKLALDMNTFQLKVIDRNSNTELWRTENLWRGQNPNLTPNQYLFANQGGIRHAYQVQGHLVIYNLGYMVYGLDPVDKKKLWEYNLFGARSLSQQARIAPDRDGVLQIVYSDGFIQRLGQTGPVEPSYVCLSTQNGLVALEPHTGVILWEKTDVSRKCQIFGDDRHVYIVELDNNNAPSSTRAVRAEDGVSVSVPPFAELYQRRIRTVGRNLLLRDDVNGQVVLRLYDVHTGQDLWKQAFAANSIILRSEEEWLAGVMEPTGVLSVVDLAQRKALFTYRPDANEDVRVRPEFLDKVQDGHLLIDAEQVYVALNRPPDPNLAPWGGGPWSNVSYGLRAVPVNGMVLAFGRDTGKLNWYNQANSQMLVVDQFKDLPIVLMTARYNKLINQGVGRVGAMQFVAVKAVHKRTGKHVYDKPELPNSHQHFYALNTDLRAGTIELVSYNLKIRFNLEGERVGAANSAAGAAQAAVEPAPVPRPGVRLGIGLAPGGGIRPVPLPAPVPQPVPQPVPKED